MRPPEEDVMSVIHLAGGCFWGLEKAFEGLPGIVSTQCGYANGDPHFVPDYMLVCSGRYGYREAVRVEYDPCAISLEEVLSSFFYLIDPTQERGQGNDVGEQYRTGVYWSDEASEKVVRKAFEEQSKRHAEFYTEMGPLTGWTPAEAEHQKYLDRNPSGYCHIPQLKIEALRMMLDRGRRRGPSRLPIRALGLGINTAST